MIGILAAGTYLPRHVLDLSSRTAVVGKAAANGSRLVASFDEDAATLAVEASRVALRSSQAEAVPTAVVFATTEPPYLVKNNAATVHAALQLPRTTGAYDAGGAGRSGVGALRLALQSAHQAGPVLIASSGMPTCAPLGADETTTSDAAAALIVGAGDNVIAEFLGWGAASAEFMDRWRLPENPISSCWEERFSEGPYLELVDAALEDALKGVGLAPSDLTSLLVAGTHSRAVRAAARRLGSVAAQSEHLRVFGASGAATGSLAICEWLESAQPGETFALVHLSDGVDVAVLRATAAITRYQEGQRAVDTLAGQLATATNVSYGTYLTWRGLLSTERPRRPDPARPSGPASLRSEDWKFGFVGSRCDECGTRHLPPQRVCLTCAAKDRREPVPMADVPAKVVTFTLDELAYSLNPPTVIAVIDFEGGGRFQCEMTDVVPDKVAIGMPVEMTFRRLFTSDSIHNYFWKARPAAPGKGN